MALERALAGNPLEDEAVGEADHQNGNAFWRAGAGAVGVLPPLRESGRRLRARAEHDWTPFEGAPGAFHDSPGARVSLVSTVTIGEWDRRRFRSNVLLDGDGEDSLVGAQVSLGDAVIEVGMRIERCVMTVRPQPAVSRATSRCYARSLGSAITVSR